MAKVLLQTSDVPTIEVVSGPQKGSRIPLKGSTFTIGRGEDNDIVVQSESISRNHASLFATDTGFVVRDNDSKNGVIVNGTRRAETRLKTGDQVQIGDFAFIYYDKWVAPPRPQDFEVQEVVPTPPQKCSRRRGGGNSKRFLIYTILSLFLGAAYWVSKSDSPTESDSKKDPVEPAPENAAPPKANVPVVGEPGIRRAEEALSKLDWSDSALREAEQYFRRGARDLSNENYHRAIEAFQTALQLDKRHIASKKYLSWAIQEAEFAAKKNRDIGIRYYESLQYQRAIHHFQEVITLMGHRPSDAMVGQAEKYIQYSKRALEAADYFP